MYIHAKVKKEGFKPLVNIFDDDINKCKETKQVEKGIICDCDEYKCLVKLYQDTLQNFMILKRKTFMMFK
jgi:hypothetical protein